MAILHKVSDVIIKKNFQNCGNVQNHDLMGVEEVELRVFEVLVQELGSDDSAKEYVSFDINIPAPEYETNWCQKHEKTASMSSSTKIMYARKHREFWMLMMTRRKMISKNKSSALQNLLQFLTK